MNSGTNTFIYETDIADFAITYDWDYTPPENGDRGSWGEQLSPDLPDLLEIEVIAVFQVDGHEEKTGFALDLSESKKENLFEICEEHLYETTGD